MKKQTSSKWGFINSRNLIALLLCTAGISLVMLSVNATASNRKQEQTAKGSGHGHGPALIAAAGPAPTSGTLSRNSGTLAYTESAALVPNATGQGVGFSVPNCAAPNTCSTYTLSLDPNIFVAASGYDPSKNVILIQISWPTSAQQYNVWVEDKNGNGIASNTSGVDPASVAISVATPNLQANGPYTIVTAVAIGGGQGYGGTVKLVQIASGGPAPSPAPRYQAYVFPGVQSSNTGLEPSIGVDWNPNVASFKHVAPGNASVGPTLLNTGGVTMFTETFDEFRVNFDDCSSPAINSWTNTAFVTEQQATSDAIGFTDHYTTAALGTSYPPPLTPGRTFQGQLTGGDSITAFTDDDGNNYTPSQGGGVPQGPDHETIGAGPYNPNSTPAPPPHPLYPNAVYYCTQNIAPEAECSRSDDGGQTYGPSIPVYNLQQCTGAIHGHVKVARDGTVYLPNWSCTLPTGSQGVAVSEDNGITWTERNVTGSGGPKPGLVDPSVGIGLNDTGKDPGQTANRIYLGYIDSDGTPKIAVSKDKGQNWSAPQNVGALFGLLNTTFPVVVAGDDNRAAFAFLGTTTPGNSSTDANFPGVWHMYIATTYDGGNNWATIDATPFDPIQVGPVCNAGTIGCPAGKRNLLDFNGFDVDAQGRGLIAATDGCLNCTNSSASSDSLAAQAIIFRQSGGPRLFSHFDPVEPMPPANPQAVSAVKGASGVLISWLEPDNGGDTTLYPITGYNVYRGTASGTETFLAHVTNDPLNKHTKYLDTTTQPNVPAYFYHVSAVNNIGESGFCQELSIGTASCLLGGSPCVAPFSVVNCAGALVPPFATSGDPTSGELTIQNVSIGEPFTSCTDNSLTFVMRVQNLDPSGTGTTVLPPNSEWQVLFSFNDTNGNPRTGYVAVSTIPPNSPATPAVTLGRRDPRTDGLGTIDTGICTQSATATCAILTGTETKDGTITFKLNTASIITFGTANSLAVNTAPFMWDARNPGTQLSSVGGNTYVLVGAGAGLLETVTTTGVTGSYTRVGNISCSNKPPVAILSAIPQSGNAPLMVSFDASASNEPTGSCGTINSYTLDFGDGGAAVTQNSPNFSHSYPNPGFYPARLTVHDTAGQVSSNPAEVIITVNSAGPPALASQTPVVSRKTHGTVGMFDINLPLAGTRGVECRSGGANGNYTIVFTFANNLTSVDQATVTTGTGSVSSTVLGPNAALNLSAKQFEVNLTGVTNAQYIAVSLVNAKDSTSAIGNIIGPQMGVLIGDTTANGATNSSDISQTQSQSGLPVTSSNFREDVTVNGAINSSDISLVQSKSGTALPSTP